MMSETMANTISFAGHAASSAQFKALYSEGMALVEETASYLDGPGRLASKALPRMASVLYAAESMRLTTRLMQVASWLLLQRAVNEGEISKENARSEKEKVKFSATPSERGGPGYDQLPETLRAYIDKGDRLFDRVMQFDTLERGRMPELDPGTANGIADQLARLKAAFGRA